MSMRNLGNEWYSKVLQKTLLYRNENNISMTKETLFRNRIKISAKFLSLCIIKKGT